MAGVPQFASLYVGDLHPDVTEAMLYEIFNSVGPVASIRVCRDSVSRKSLGYGYVNFHSVSDAERALDTLNYSSIKARACRIMWSQRDPSLRKSGLGNVFVRNLDKNIDNKALYDTFSLFGNILSCKVCTGSDGKSRGYGFVHYETEEAAKQAIERVDGMQIGEKTVGVSGFVKRSDREKPAMNTFTNVYIKNFPDDWEEDKIKTEFGKHGTITSSHIATDNKGRSFAFLNFETHEQAMQAITALHQQDFRSAEQKEADKEKEEEEADRAEKSYLLYVARAQSKSERLLELKEKMPPKNPADGGQSRSQGVNLYIKNLDEATDDDSLKSLFEPFGNITSVCAMREGNGKCKGFGFVCFSTPDEATKAVTEMHLKVVKGKPLYVGLAEKREVRAERLRQRYSPGGMGGKMGGKGKGGKGGGMGGMGGMPGMGGMDFGGFPGGFPMGPMGGMGGMAGKGAGKSRPAPPAWAMPTNTAVVIHGLEKAAEHNSKPGKIIGWDDGKGRYEVEVDSGETTLSLKPQNLTQTCTVKIVGIESQPELNGRSGQILSFDRGSGRYTLRLKERLPSGRDAIGVQPANVTLPKGTRVVVANLGKEEFNGQMANITEVDEDASRYTVACQNGKNIKIKFENVIC
mmetsp:Transcript_46017/g.103343  ORF Transcript_46017/g.103343 Transcript_46017/m.103343 type:complete len:632 (+) Transcript_46017:165-2060(+)